MKWKRIFIVAVVVVVFLVICRTIYQKTEEYAAMAYVEEFLELSYNTEGQEMKEVLKAQQDYYSETTRKLHEKAFEEDLHYLQELDQTLKLVSDIDMSTSRNDVGDMVVQAEFWVEIKDVNYPDGLTQSFDLHFTLSQEGTHLYKIMNIW